MLLQQLLVPTFLLFFSPVWATFAEVVAGTARLGILSAQGDDDISQIDSFSRVQDAQKIPDGIQSISEHIITIMSDNPGIRAESDWSTQDQLTDAFGDEFLGALSQHMRHLIQKKKILTTFGQDTSIYSDLVNLDSSFSYYHQEFLRALLGDDVHMETLRELGDVGLSSIHEAEVAYRCGTYLDHGLDNCEGYS